MSNLKDILEILDNNLPKTIEDVETLRKIEAKIKSFELEVFLPFKFKDDKRKYKVKKDFKETEISYLKSGKKFLAPFFEKYLPDKSCKEQTEFDLTHLAEWTIQKMNNAKKLETEPFSFGDLNEEFQKNGMFNKLFFGAVNVPDVLPNADKSKEFLLKIVETEEEQLGKAFRRVCSTNNKRKFSNPLDNLYLLKRFHQTSQSMTRFLPLELHLLAGRKTKRELHKTTVLLEKTKVTNLETYAECVRGDSLVATFKDRLRLLFQILNKDHDWEDSFQDAGHVVAVSSSAQDTVSFTHHEKANMEECFKALCERDWSVLASEKEKKKLEDPLVARMRKEKSFLPKTVNLPSGNFLCFLNGILQDAQVNQIYYRNMEKLIQKIREEFKSFDKTKVLVKHDQFYRDDVATYFPYLGTKKWNYDHEGMISRTIPLFFVVTVMSLNKLTSKKPNELFLFFVPNNVCKMFTTKEVRDTKKESAYFVNDYFKRFSLLKNPKTDVQVLSWIIDRAYKFGCARLPQK